MIKSLQEFKKTLKENIFTPKKMEGREEKMKQFNIKLLGQLVIDGSLFIDNSFEGIDEELIKCKKIKGCVVLNLSYIPLWLKDIEIGSTFDCPYTDLTSLEGCPQIVNGDFNCSNNQLKSLEGCPQIIGGDFICYSNLLPSDIKPPVNTTIKGKFIIK